MVVAQMVSIRTGEWPNIWQPKPLSFGYALDVWDVMSGGLHTSPPSRSSNYRCKVSMPSINAVYIYTYIYIYISYISKYCKNTHRYIYIYLNNTYTWSLVDPGSSFSSIPGFSGSLTSSNKYGRAQFWKPIHCDKLTLDCWRSFLRRGGNSCSIIQHVDLL